MIAGDFSLAITVDFIFNLWGEKLPAQNYIPIKNMSTKSELNEDISRLRKSAIL